MYSLKDLIMAYYILPDGTVTSSKEGAKEFDKK